MCTCCRFNFLVEMPKSKTNWSMYIEIVLMESDTQNDKKKIASSFMVDCSMVVPIYGKYHAWKLYNVEQKVDNKFNKTIRF